MTDNPAIWRGVFFAGTLVIMAGAERCWPRRRRRQPCGRRWLGNLLLAASGSGAVWLLVTVAPVVGAVSANVGDWGLFPWLGLPTWLRVAAGLLTLDFAVWAQHLAMHLWYPGWRLHRVHHADLDLDASSGVRFHPLEIVVSALWKLAVVLLLGIGPMTYLVFEIVLSSSAVFNHGNVRLPGDRWLRWLVVTPDMHRVHHSIHRREHDHNYGFCLPWWDRLWRTYKAQPDEGHEAMTIGLDTFREPDNAGIGKLLTMPFRQG